MSKSPRPLYIVLMKTNVKVFNKQGTKLEEVQLVFGSARLDSSRINWTWQRVDGSIAIAIATTINTFLVIADVVILLFLIITYNNW